MKKTVEEDVKQIIKNIGGRSYVAKILGIKIYAVNGWCNDNRIPKHWEMEIQAAFKAKGIEVKIR